MTFVLQPGANHSVRQLRLSPSTNRPGTHPSVFVQTAVSWHRAFVEEIVPALPCFGFNYWPKFIYGDIGLHVAPDKVDLERYTFVGKGPRTLFQMWGIDLPKDGKRAQEPGLQVVRELQQIVNAVIDSGMHAGIEAARKEAGLRPLSAYDVQVQGCECKRGHKLPGRVAKARIAKQLSRS